MICCDCQADTCVLHIHVPSDLYLSVRGHIVWIILDVISALIANLFSKLVNLRAKRAEAVVVVFRLG